MSGGLVVGPYWDGGDLADTLDASNASKQQMTPEKRRFQAVITQPLTGNPYVDHESREALLVTHALRADGFDASEDGTGRGTPLVPVAFDCKASGRNGFGVGDIAPTLRAMGHLKTHQNAGGQVAVATQWAVRRLTPLECCRLQGFPDDYLDIIYRGKPAADGPKYKALGNSMARPVMRWIGERIAKATA